MNTRFAVQVAGSGETTFSPAISQDLDVSAHDFPYYVEAGVGPDKNVEFRIRYGTRSEALQDAEFGDLRIWYGDVSGRLYTIRLPVSRIRGIDDQELRTIQQSLSERRPDRRFRRNVVFGMKLLGALFTMNERFVSLPPDPIPA